MSVALDRLLRPQSIAVIGGGAWCEAVVAGLKDFDGPVWSVHPTRATIGDRPAYASLGALPASPDAAFVGVRRDLTIEMVRSLAAMGAGGAVCFASGFQEVGADDLQDALVAAAAEMPILGPNCYGFLNLLDNVALWPDRHGALPVARGVAIVAQSSNIALNLTMQRRGVPLAYVVCAGNQAAMSLPDIGQALLADPRVTALGLHIEGVDLRGLEALAASARACGKPIVALKVGASEHAQAAALSHTASLAGSDTGAAALFARLGIGRVSTPAAFLETLKLLHVVGPLPSTQVAAMSCSGGEAALVADLAHGLTFPDLSAAQRAALLGVLGDRVPLSNPLDYHTYIWGDEAATAACFEAMLSPKIALGLAVLDFPKPEMGASPDWDKVVRAAATAQAASKVPMALVSSLPETMPEPVARSALDQGLLPLCGLAEALEAVHVAATPQPPGAPAPVLVGGGTKATLVPEAAAKAALAEFGLVVPRARSAATPQEAAEQAAHIGFPVVLKGRGAAHKSEAGLVALGLTSEQAVLAAAEAMASDGFLVEAMITDPVAELLLGVVADPAHGFVLTLGAGGTWTELWQDTQSLLLPATEAAILAALDRLRIAPLLKGYRGAPAAAAPAIVAAVKAVEAYVIAHAAQVNEVEINPLVCTPDAAIAVDALIRQGEPG